MKVRKQHLQIALFVLAAAVVWNLWSYFKPSAVPQRPATTEPLLGAGTLPAAQAAALDPASIPAPPDVDVVQGPSWIHDPFLFGNESRSMAVERTQAATTTRMPLVRSILVSSARRVAIVDGQMVSVGDSVGSMKVVQIDADAVVFVTVSGERRRVAVHRAMPTGLTR